MNTFTKTEVFLSIFVQKRSSVNVDRGPLRFPMVLVWDLQDRDHARNLEEKKQAKDEMILFFKQSSVRNCL